MLKEKYSLKDFLPLIVIFAVIVLFTTVMIVQSDTPDVMFAMQMFMAGFFLVFGFFKVINLKGFVDAYSMYDIVAKRSRTYGYIYPFIELALGVAYLVGWNLLVTNWVTLVVMGVSSVGVAKKLLEREQIPCACLGVVFKIPMTWVTFVEDVLMAVMALAMVTSMSGSPSATTFSDNENIVAYFGETEVLLELADTQDERTRGLSGRESLQEGAGMLFVFDEPGEHGIWMKDMNFAIDVLWLTEEFQIIYVVENMTPESFPNVYHSSKPALYVVELPLGFVEQHSIVIHDFMTPFSS